jgi:tetratricopeptide (TPR) repeat protein
VPGWHEATRELEQQGEFRTIGIVEEQHAARARLFMQWKRINWPLLVDSLNLLQVPYVPITVLIDEHGIVRAVQPPSDDPQWLRDEFIDRTYDAPTDPAHRGPDAQELRDLKQQAEEGDDPLRWQAYADAVFSESIADRLDEAASAYRRAVHLDPELDTAHFRLGVVYRRRYDSAAGEPADFQHAVDAWSRALEIDPNNYIYRRRIQQYGPRMEKPYPFYDWVETAREEIEARGESPAPLPVEPRGAELAEPARGFDVDSEVAHWNPRRKILRDPGKFVSLHATVVPSGVQAGSTTRLHLEFRPRTKDDAYWANEGGGLTVWLDPPRGWLAERRLARVAAASDAVSLESRRVEIDLRAPEAASAGPAKISGFALYYVCEGTRGACLYRRQDFEATVEVKQAGSEVPRPG